MPSENESTATPRPIEYFSRPAQVSMSDDYFQIAGTDHFWVERRFRVLQKLGGELLHDANEIAEIGCGHGLLQRQIEIAYQKRVTGFDLNEFGLKHNISQQSRVCCYDIFQKAEEFRAKFDLILLFDVLEHITDEEAFLRAICFHMAPGSTLAVSVPANQWAFSNYDRVAGHVRRYSIATLKSAAERASLSITRWTYWGFPLLPTLLARKLVVGTKKNDKEIYQTGFSSRNSALNSSLAFVAGLEMIPQHIAGTSVMALFQSDPQRGSDAAR